MTRRDISNRVAEVAEIDRIHRARPSEAAEGVIVHRFDFKAARVEPNAVAVAKFFSDRSLGTGGESPYTFFVHPQPIPVHGGASNDLTLIEQALACSDVGPHARVWNARAYGVAMVGDFRRHGPTEAQWRTARDLTVLLMLKIGPHAWVKGHTEPDLKGGTSDPKKECPGRFWHMPKFRDECLRDIAIVRERVAADAIIEENISKFADYSLIRCGVTL